MYQGLSVRSYVWMLALAKPRIKQGWDLVSLISLSETHQTAARNTGVLPVSARALTLCNMYVRRAARTRRCSDHAQMPAPAKTHNG
jgi:hypothetical protein